METNTTNTVQSTTTVLAVDASELARVLGNAALFAGTDKARPVLNAVRVQASSAGETIHTMATDSYMLGWDEAALVAPSAADVDVLLPRDFVLSAVKLLKAAKGAPATMTVAVDRLETTVTVASAGSSISDAAYVHGEFPKVDTLIVDRPMELYKPVGFNATFLAKFAKVVAADVRKGDIQPALVITYADEFKPARFTVGRTFHALLMPVRIAR